MSSSQQEECFEMGRFVRAQSAAFNSPNYQALPTLVDTRIDLDVEPEKPISSVDSDTFMSDFLLLEEEPTWELDVTFDDDALEMELEQESFTFGINTSPKRQEHKSYSIPYRLDTRKKRKKLKKLIGKLSRERRHAENTKVKLQWRRTLPFVEAKNLLHTEYGDAMKDELHIQDYQDAPRSCLALV